jgi:hypothetical protein
VPPHRSSHPEEWGSDPRHARLIGEEAVAISKGAKAMEIFEKALQHYRKLGFKTLVESKESHVIPVSRFPKWVYWLAARFPGLSHRLGAFGLVQSILRTLNRSK